MNNFEESLRYSLSLIASKRIIFIGILIVSFAFLDSNCNNSTPIDPPEFGFDYPFGLVSGEQKQITIRWKTKDFSGDAAFNIYLVDGQNNILALLASPSSSVTKGIEGSAQVLWTGMMKDAAAGSNARLRPIPPGTGYISMRVYSSGNLISNLDPLQINVERNSYDYDGDGISDAVEDENNKTTGVGQTSILLSDGTIQTGQFVRNDLDRPPLIPLGAIGNNRVSFNRGTHDHSISSNILADSDPNSNASLYNGLRIAHQSTSYYYWQNIDAIDTDNWATLALINLIEKVAREWNKSHPNYPLTTLDMSRRYGGYWSDHDSHQKGTSLDICYVGTGAYDFYNLGNNYVVVSSSHYDADLNYELFSLFLNFGNINRIYSSDGALLRDSRVQLLSGHSNHFHVEINDPDGTSN